MPSVNGTGLEGLAIAMLALEPRHERYLKEGLGSATIHACQTTRDLADLLDRQPGIGASVVELLDTAGCANALLIGHVATAHPLVPVVAVTQVTPAALHALTEPGCQQLAAVLAADHDAPLPILTSVALRRAPASDAARLLHAVGVGLPPPLQRVMDVCLLHAAEHPTVEDVARLAGIHRRTLASWLRRRHLPPLSGLISWARLFVAAQLLQRSRSSVEAVALELNLSSGAALHNLVRRYVGCTAGELRRGGAERVGRAFTLALRQGAACEEALSLRAVVRPGSVRACLREASQHDRDRVRDPRDQGLHRDPVSGALLVR